MFKREDLKRVLDTYIKRQDRVRKTREIARKMIQKRKVHSKRVWWEA
jgi:ribosomal 50S subunit-recycling heat shock protein